MPTQFLAYHLNFLAQNQNPSLESDLSRPCLNDVYEIRYCAIDVHFFSTSIMEIQWKPSGLIQIRPPQQNRGGMKTDDVR